MGTTVPMVLMVLMALIAGGMIAAIMLPIYSLVNTLQV